MKMFLVLFVDKDIFYLHQLLYTVLFGNYGIKLQDIFGWVKTSKRFHITHSLSCLVFWLCVFTKELLSEEQFIALPWNLAQLPASGKYIKNNAFIIEARLGCLSPPNPDIIIRFKMTVIKFD